MVQPAMANCKIVKSGMARFHGELYM